MNDENKKDELKSQGSLENLKVEDGKDLQAPVGAVEPMKDETNASSSSATIKEAGGSGEAENNQPQEETSAGEKNGAQESSSSEGFEGQSQGETPAGGESQAGTGEETSVSGDVQGEGSSSEETQGETPASGEVQGERNPSGENAVEGEPLAEEEQPKKSKFNFPKKINSNNSVVYKITDEGEMKTEVIEKPEKEEEDDKKSKKDKKNKGKKVEETKEEESKDGGEKPAQEIQEAEKQEGESKPEGEASGESPNEGEEKPQANQAESLDEGEQEKELPQEIVDAQNKTEVNATTGGGMAVVVDEGKDAKKKFSLFPTKVKGNNGAVNGQKFDKEKIKDNNRSARRSKYEYEVTEEDEINQIQKPKKRWVKVASIIVSCILGLCLIVGIYIGYLELGFDRLYDYKYLTVAQNRSNLVAKNKEYDIITYNLCYGMMDNKFSYYKASGYLANGASVKGSSSRAKNEEMVSINIKGSAGLVSTGAYAGTDVILLQEVDDYSTRSFYVDQRSLINEIMFNYAQVYAEYGKSNYVLYPLGAATGKINCSMATMSAFKVSSAVRYSLPSSREFLKRYTSTDNGFLVTKYGIVGEQNKVLTVINVDVSMYDDDEIRKADLEKLYEFMDGEYNKRGNYVIVGGSFSYLLNGDRGAFSYNMRKPDWCKELPEGFGSQKLGEIGYRICSDVASLEQGIGTVRDQSVEYKAGEVFEAIVDGFIVSDNMTVVATNVINNNFMYSAHNPVKLSFKLN